MCLFLFGKTIEHSSYLLDHFLFLIFFSQFEDLRLHLFAFEEESHCDYDYLSKHRASENHASDMVGNDGSWKSLVDHYQTFLYFQIFIQTPQLFKETLNLLESPITILIEFREEHRFRQSQEESPDQTPILLLQLPFLTRTKLPKNNTNFQILLDGLRPDSVSSHPLVDPGLHVGEDAAAVLLRLPLDQRMVHPLVQNHRLVLAARLLVQLRGALRRCDAVVGAVNG